MSIGCMDMSRCQAVATTVSYRGYKEPSSFQTLSYTKRIFSQQQSCGKLAHLASGLADCWSSCQQEITGNLGNWFHSGQAVWSPQWCFQEEYGHLLRSELGMRQMPWSSKGLLLTTRLSQHLSSSRSRASLACVARMCAVCTLPANHR